MVLAVTLHESRHTHEEDGVFLYAPLIPEYDRRMEVIGLRAREWAEWVEAIPWELVPTVPTKR